MNNLILIGMPGTGKSVVGRHLAACLGLAFVDLDDVMTARTGMTLPDILRRRGLAAFCAIEEEVGASAPWRDTVIATGGSMVLYPRAMARLRAGGVTVWLQTPLSTLERRMPRDLWDRGIAAPAGQTLREIYAARRELYAQYADLSFAARRGAADTARHIAEALRAEKRGPFALPQAGGLP